MADTLRQGIVDTILDAVATTTIGDAYGIPYTKAGINLGWQMTFTGSPSGVSTTLQVSIDKTNWATIDTGTNTAGEYRIVGAVIGKWLRAVLGTLTAGTSPTATCKILVL